MRTIKKVSAAAIKKVLPGTVEAKYDQVLAKLGPEAMPLARYYAAASGYEWRAGGEWQPITAAPAELLPLVSQAVDQVRAALSAAFSQKEADALCSVPDDSYIFFRQDGGQVRVILAGWGFKKPVATRSSGDVKTLRQKKTTTLGFFYDGRLLPDYEFAIQLAHQTKVLRTDASGLFTFQEMKSGQHYEVTDLPSGRTFALDVVPGQTDYRFDVTRSVPVCVTASCDGQPLSDEDVALRYRDTDCTLPLSAGKALLEVPYYAGETVEASLRSEQRRQPLTQQGADIHFELESELPPEPPQQPATVSILADENGQPIQGEAVSLSYAGTAYPLTLGPDGRAEQKLAFVPEAEAEVQVRDEKQRGQIDSAGTEFVFHFKRELPPPPAAPYRFSLRDAQGLLLPAIPLTLTQAGAEPLCLTSDEQGDCLVSAELFERFSTERDITASIPDPSNLPTPTRRSIDTARAPGTLAVSFRRTEDEHEYMLRMQQPQKPSLWKQLLVAGTAATTLTLLWPVWRSLIRAIGNYVS